MWISLIAAMTEKGVIGQGDALPWHLPEDLKYFKSNTLHKPIIMGRKTFETIGSKPLPDRHNIVLTREKSFKAKGCTIVHGVEEALSVAGNCDEIMVIGGAKVYEAFLPLATRLYLTLVHHPYEGDTYFPKLHEGDWVVILEEKHPLFTTQILQRKI
jgi:dihydrofolate reductase